MDLDTQKEIDSEMEKASLNAREGFYGFGSSRWTGWQ